MRLGENRDPRHPTIRREMVQMDVQERGASDLDTWPVVLEAVHSLFPLLPVVGYEHGEALAAAVRHGFEPIGPLRVWLRA